MNRRSAPAVAAASAIPPPIGPDVVAIETSAVRDLRPERVAQAPDERPVGRGQVGVDPLDVDIDAVDADPDGKRDQAVDGRVLERGRAEEALVPRRPEARVGELDVHAAIVCLADELLADAAGDALVAELLGVDRTVLGVRDREQGERRQRRPGEVLGDAVVHLPVRHEAEQLVLRDRSLGRDGRDRRWSGRRRHRVRGRGCPRRGCARSRTGAGAGARARPERQPEGDDRDDADGTDADDGPSGHGDSLRPTPDRVKRARESRTPAGPIGSHGQGGDVRAIQAPGGRAGGENTCDVGAEP